MTVAVFPPLLFFLARSHSPAIVARKSSLFPRKIQIVPGNLNCAFYSYLWSVGVAARVLFSNLCDFTWLDNWQTTKNLVPSPAICLVLIRVYLHRNTT
jgi:hypothetical protein